VDREGVETGLLGFCQTVEEKGQFFYAHLFRLCHLGDTRPCCQQRVMMTGLFGRVGSSGDEG
tara:strand:- start:11352 stop:11537 length:186 start_codon:yes stop_codon:yes gene_type:complete